MELGKLTAVFDADTRKFDAGIRGVQSKMSLVTTEAKALTASAAPLSSSLSGLSSNFALAAGGAVLFASAISGVAVGLFELVKSSAALGGELFDLSQKTNFAVETLSGLSIVAKTTGSDIKSISNSLFIFQSNMVKAAEGNEHLAKTFKDLKIDTQDQEKALRQAISALFKMGETERQSTRAKELFGKAGKDVLGIIKETNGDLDAAITKYAEMGLIISTSAARASDRFNDTLEETTLQLSAVTRSIGMELLPVATQALRDISFWLAQNKDAWSSWGRTIADVISGVGSVVNSWVGTMISDIARLSFELTGVLGLIRGLGAVGAGIRTGGMTPEQARQGAIDVNESVLARVQARLARMQDRGTAGGGGGGGGGGGRARKPKAAEPDFDEIHNLEDLFIQLRIKASEAREEQKRLLSEMLGTPVTHIEALIRLYEEMTKAAEAGERALIGGGVPTAARDLEDFMGTEPPDISKQSQAILDMREQIREQMMELGHDLTSVFSRAIGDGFEQGAKRGLQSLALGLLDIVQNVLLKNLAEGLGNILSNVALGSGGGGGLFQRLIGIGLGAIGGSIGGSVGSVGGNSGPVGSGIGNFARGGYIPPGKWGIVGEQGPERAFGGRSGMTVVPNGGGGNNYTYNINLPPAPRGNTVTRKSARQQAEMLVAALQGV